MICQCPLRVKYSSLDPDIPFLGMYLLRKSKGLCHPEICIRMFITILSIIARN